MEDYKNATKYEVDKEKMLLSTGEARTKKYWAKDEFGEYVKHFMDENNLSYYQFANRVNVTAVSISRITRGQQHIIRNPIMWANALNTSVDKVLSMLEEPISEQKEVIDTISPLHKK